MDGRRLDRDKASRPGLAKVRRRQSWQQNGTGKLASDTTTGLSAAERRLLAQMPLHAITPLSVKLV